MDQESDVDSLFVSITLDIGRRRPFKPGSRVEHKCNVLLCRCERHMRPLSYALWSEFSVGVPLVAVVRCGGYVALCKVTNDMVVSSLPHQ